MGFRLRVNFQKLDTCRYLSHLEVARALERCVRRAGLPYTVSQGFAAHMQHSFGPALPVGTAGLSEYMDLELREYLPPSVALAALQQAAVAQLPVIDVSYVGFNQPSLQAYYTRASYEIEFYDPDHSLASQLLAALRDTDQITVQKKGRPKPYRLSEFMDRACAKRVVAAQRDASRLFLVLLASEQGSLRPEVILTALCASDQKLAISSIIRVGLQGQDEWMAQQDCDLSAPSSLALAGKVARANV